MHIEPGIVTGSKLTLSYITAAGSIGLIFKAVIHSFNISQLKNAVPALSRCVATTLLTICFFELLPHRPVGVSEVHLILGSTLFLLFGVTAAAIGLICGLCFQSFFIAPFDIPQLGMNITTLLVPLFAMSQIAKRVIPVDTPYKDLCYRQTLKLSITYQSGIISWVTFWAIYGQGLTVANISNIASFATAYATVILVEPLVDLAVLKGVKSWHKVENTFFLNEKLF